MPETTKSTKKTGKKTSSKKTTSSKKKTTTKSSSSKSSSPKKSSKGGSALAQATSILKSALKSTDWVTDLDPKNAKKSQDVLSTGSLIINHLIGGKANEYGVAPCPGLPKGRIVNVYGKEGSGKTTLSLTAAAETIRNGGTVCYIDWEHEIVPGYAMALGVPIGDPDKFLLCQPETLEEGVAILWTMATAGVDLIVLDSVGAGVPRAYFEKAVKETAEQGRVGANAAIWSQFLPKLKGRIMKTGTTVIGISQIRDSINTMGYGDNFTVQGGKAWKFYSAVRMRLQPIGQEKASEYSAIANKAADRVVGSRIKAKLDKCKVSPQQGNEEVFYIRYGKGIDDLRSLLEIGIAHKLIQKSGSWFSWIDPTGEEHRAQGMEKFRGSFDENAQMTRILQKQVLPYLGSTGGAASSDGDDDDLFDGQTVVADEISDIIGGD